MRGNGHLTVKGIEAARAGLHADGGGLYLRVAKSGSRRWAFIYRRGSKRTELGLGGYPDTTLAQARARAAEQRRLLLDGADPLLVRRAAQLASRPAPLVTFGDAADRLLANMAPRFRNAKHRQQWEMTLSVHAAGLRALPVSAVGTGDVLAVLQPLWHKTPETAARLRGRIERVLDFARVQGWRVGENPARWRGHLDSALPKPAARDRGHHAALAYARIPAFMAEVAARSFGSSGAQALAFTILTASRTRETLGARWEEIDQDRGIWTVPAARMKVGREHRVPLSSVAMALLRELRMHVTGPYLFPGTQADKPISDMAMTMTLRRMGRTDITVHGFRSSFRDWAAECTDHPNEVCEAALAHTLPSRVEAAYRRGDLLEKRRRLMEEWGTYCSARCQTNQKSL
jgi:integrase